MEQREFLVDDRKDLGKGPSRRLRALGKIPAVIYGQGKVKTVSLDEHEFSKGFKTLSENTIITLRHGKSSSQVLLKDFQEDITTGEIRHLDFFEIKKGKALRTHVPVTLTGTAVGVRIGGGILSQPVSELEVECLPKDLPEDFKVDVSELELGESIHVRDLPEVKGIRVLTLSDETVAVITHATTAESEASAEEEEEFGGAEKEV